MNKLGWVAVVVLLCLAACRQTPEPLVIQYPDDPKVPHGTWLVEPVARQAELQEFQFDAAGDDLIMRIGGDIVRYGSGAGRWARTAGGRPAGTYDLELDAYVNVRRQGEQLQVDIVNMAGEASSTVIELPENVDPGSFRSGSGIVVGLTGTGEAGMTIDWWDTLTGEYQGRHEVSGHTDGMRASGDGRALAFSSVRAGRLTVFSLDDPEELFRLRMGACSSAGGNLSSDGRWFVGSSCMGRSTVYDLRNPGSGSHSIMVPSYTAVAVSRDSAELIWFDEVAGNLMVADITDGSREILHHLSADDARYMDFVARNRDLYLNRTAGILAFNTFRGALRVIDLNEGAGELLPAFDLGDIRIELASQPLEGAEAPYEHLNLSGTWLHGGAEYQVTGFAEGGEHHRYRPADLEAARLPPRPASVRLEVLDPAGDEEDFLWTLGASMDGPESSSYNGRLNPGTASGWSWDIRLVRP